MEKTNIGQLFSSTGATVPLKVGQTTFDVFDVTTITMVKVVDKIGGIYFPNQDITFTVTITSLGLTPLSGLYFTDVIDPSVVPLSGAEFDVTTTNGTITDKGQTVKIENISIAALGTVVITIHGKIA